MGSSFTEVLIMRVVNHCLRVQLYYNQKIHDKWDRK